MTRRTLLGALAAPLLPASVISTEIPDWVRLPGHECAHCGERPDGAEGTIWCASCLSWYRRNYTLEWIREQPSAGDSIRCKVTGNRVTVDRVVEGAGIVFYTLIRPNGEKKERGVWIKHWQENPAWATAEVA